MHVKKIRNMVATAAALTGAVVLVIGVGSAGAKQEPQGTAKTQSMAPAKVGTVANSAAEAHPLAVGSRVPKVTLRTVDNKPFVLRKEIKKQPTVLVFYRGGWCPFCNAHLAQMQTVVDELKGMGYQIVAITPDLPENIQNTVGKNHLTYTLVSDPNGDALRAFGVAFRVDDATYNLYKEKYQLDLEKWSGNKEHLLPVPSVFVLDTKGTIRFVHSNADYKVRLAADKVVAAAREAKAQP